MTNPEPNIVFQELENTLKHSRAIPAAEDGPSNTEHVPNTGRDGLPKEIPVMWPEKASSVKEWVMRELMLKYWFSE